MESWMEHGVNSRSGATRTGTAVFSAALLLIGLCCNAGAADSASEQQAKRAQGVDAILAAEVKLGSDEWHAQRLALSQRHHEMVSLPHGGRTLQAFVVHPVGSERVPVLLMIPEDQGLNNWARDMADQLSAMGYLVVVPDLYAGYGPHGGGRDAFPDAHAALMALNQLTEPVMTADLNVWGDYAKALPQSNGKLAVVGFAWGGGRAFWFATQRKDLSAAFIFYDWAPPASALAGLTAPVYAFYAAIDPRVTATLETTKAAMAAAGKRYEPVTYPGSEHMFVRLGDEPGNTNPANIEARLRALGRLQELLRGL